MGAHQGSTGLSHRIKLNQGWLGLLPKNRYHSKGKRQAGDEGCKAKTTAPDGKDAGWGEPGIREEL